MDWDRKIDRQHSASLKWDGRKRLFGTEDVLPLWVADMDFAVPEAVQQALVDRAAHPVFGYTEADGAAERALCLWWSRRHGWLIQPEWIELAPGVVPSLYAAVHVFTHQGDGVLIQTPVYPPFFSAISDLGRRCVENPLILGEEGYRIDWEHFERVLPECRLFLLCSPHNPVGRAWTEPELRRMLQLCRLHGVQVVADEIHADLMLAGQKHVAAGGLGEPGIVVFVAPSKTFNIPGLGLSAVVIEDPNLRQRWRSWSKQHPVNLHNPFSLLAFEVAYTKGEHWLDALLPYLTANCDVVTEWLRGHQQGWVRGVPPQATYLYWLDFQALGLDGNALQATLIKAGVGLSQGRTFGLQGEGFMRLNFALPRAELIQALHYMDRLCP